MRIQAAENELVGRWISEVGGVRADAVCERIQELTSTHLLKVAEGRQSGGWEVLFQDPDDGRFWELTYPESHRHGGGPPRLLALSSEQARVKYAL